MFLDTGLVTTHPFIARSVIVIGILAMNTLIYCTLEEIPAKPELRDDAKCFGLLAMSFIAGFSAFLFFRAGATIGLQVLVGGFVLQLLASWFQMKRVNRRIGTFIFGVERVE